MYLFPLLSKKKKNWLYLTTQAANGDGNFNSFQNLYRISNNSGRNVSFLIDYNIKTLRRVSDPNGLCQIIVKLIASKSRLIQAKVSYLKVLAAFYRSLRISLRVLKHYTAIHIRKSSLQYCFNAFDKTIALYVYPILCISSSMYHFHRNKCLISWQDCFLL